MSAHCQRSVRTNDPVATSSSSGGLGLFRPVAAALAGAYLLAFGCSASAATTVSTTTSYDYDAATGLLTKSIVEPGDSNLCLVTQYTSDAYGHRKVAVTRNCNGSPATVAGAVNEAPAPSGQAAFPARTTTNVYSADERFISTTTNAINQTETKTYDARFGTISTLEGPNQLTTTWTYDGLGRKTMETRADGTRTKWDYVYCLDPGIPAWPSAPVGAATAACPAVSADYALLGTDSVKPLYYVQTTPLRADGITPNGPFARVYYDTLGREIRSETQGFDGAGSSQAIYQDTRYDRAGNAIAKSRPYYPGTAVYWVSYKHDVLGRTTHEIELNAAAGPATTLTTYSGLSTTVADPRGFTTTQVKNPAGQVAKITDAAGGNLIRAYDPLGNLVQTTDANGNVISMVYDVRGRKTALYDPDIGAWSYRYNAAGELVQQTNAKSQVTTLRYDDLGRLIGRTEPDLTSTWYYDKNADGTACGKGVGKLCQATTDNGYDRKSLYDGFGRPSSTTSVINSTAYTASVLYDPSTGRVGTQVYPTGVQLSNIYTALGYLRSIVDTRNGVGLWTANSMDAQGHLLQFTYGNGVVTTDNYFADGRLNTRQAGTSNSVQSLSYGYDLNRNVDARIDVVTGVSATYAYDALNRLTSESRSGGGVGTNAQVIGWTYDAIGNMTSRTESGTSNTYNYNSSGMGSRRPHAVASVSGSVNGYVVPRYDYDDNGNLISGAGRTVNWASSDIVQRITAGAKRLDFHYSPERDRVKETYYLNGAQQRVTVYVNPSAGTGLFYEEESGIAGSRKKHYVSAGGSTVAVIICTASPCTNTANTSTQYWHGDHLGSVSAVTNGSGAVVERMGYEPFGKRRNSNGVTDTYGSHAPITTDRGYTEHEHIDEVGLINMNGRIYDPGLGRFMSSDPSVPYPDSTQSYNRYSYVRNNPLRMLDPSGFDDYDFGGDVSLTSGFPPYSSGFSMYGSYGYSDWGAYSILPGDIDYYGSGTLSDPLASFGGGYGWDDSIAVPTPNAFSQANAFVNLDGQLVQVFEQVSVTGNSRHVPYTLGDAFSDVREGRANGAFADRPYIGDVLSDDAFSAILRSFGRSEGEVLAASLAIGMVNPAGLLKSGAKVAAKGSASALEKVVARNGGQIVKEGAQFATRREARQAASEMAGSLGSDVQAIRMRDFKQADVPWGLKDSNRVIGRQSADGLSGWRDDFLGHPQFQMGPHVNVWTNGSSFHFFY